ncbi:Crossover junction endonuclease mus81 [Coemansia brasiliensis]|uniref:Crossover junction endonuclease MUS81 n=1 Tax=Coemansia brasiliensis TaxID=2650707 RepID=A0A9W8I4T8_9FUNG|nr:Crossover junction endonuclease mus81 [Coemansia brasiliensis]
MTTEEESECANPLFLKWINQWYEEARASNNKTQYTLKKALTSLQRYPLPIANPQDTTQLQGIGQGIANKLAKKLASWRKENGIAEPAAESTIAPGNASVEASTSSSSRPKAQRLYVPRYRSGAFALLIGLFKTYCLYGPDYFIPKNELISLCEPYTDTPFHVSGSASYGGGPGYSQHTAWSGMKTLEAKSLAERQGGVKFCITEDGVDIAKKVFEVLRSRNELSEEDKQMLMQFTSRQQQQQQATSPLSSDIAEFTDSNGLAQKSMAGESIRPHVIPASRTSSAASFSRQSSAASFSRQSSAGVGIEQAELTCYPAGSYDIVLVIDNREVHSSADRALIERELENEGTKVEIRPLTVGDYLWIARAKSSSTYKHFPDIVLDYVVERKRMDDLCASIRDGRYREQHSRIHASGFTNVFYVVEGNDPDAVSRLGEAAVNSALSRVQIHHGFHLKRPQTFEATLRLLKQISETLQDSLADIYAIPDHLIGHRGFSELKKSLQLQFPHLSLAMTFDAYDVVSNKSASLSVGEIYLRMLMTLRGVSADKALSIGSRYQTVQQLIDVLESEDGAKTIGELNINGTCRKIGPALAKKLDQFWTADSFDTT